MKKIYNVFIALTVVAVTSSVSFAQTDFQLGTADSDQNTVTLKQTQPGDVTNGGAQSTQAVCTNILATSLTGGNNFDGNMFDITNVNATSTVTIETFSVSFDLPATIEIYVRSGSFVGFESSSAGWTLVGTGNINGVGVGFAEEVPVDIAYPMTAGSTHGFYVTATATGSTCNYTNGTAVGATWAVDANLDLKEGNGGGYFAVTFSPRNFNGNVIYCLPTGVTETLNSTNVSIFPNPASDELNISLPSMNGTATTMTIYNTLGAVVMTENITTNGTTSKFDISSLNSGIYFVKLAADNFEYSSKLFVD